MSRSRHSLVAILFVMFFIVFASGCSLITPSISSTPHNNSKEVSPDKGISFKIGGLGTKVVKIDVKVDGKPAEAKLTRSGRLLVNGKTGLQTDTRYSVRVHVESINGRQLTRGFAFLTATTPKPLLTEDPLVVTNRDGVDIKWNIPIKSFDYEISPSIESKSKIDSKGTTSKIVFNNYKQGKQYNLKITEAESTSGFKLAPHNPGYVQKLVTTTPITVEFDPPYGAQEVSRSTAITMTFSEDISNPQYVLRGVFFTNPAIDGDLTWPKPNQLVFIPVSSWDFETEVLATLKGGSTRLTAVSGAYLDEDKELYFVTGTYKAIDINLSNQTLTLLEGGTNVYSCLISSGKPGYSTSTGDFRIYSKDRTAPMGSTPEAAEFYYIPDVPFVMWFYGGYSIHGAYWHDEFGNVRSHGCVNVTLGDAEYIYGWAPVGTPVRVHY